MINWEIASGEQSRMSGRNISKQGPCCRKAGEPCLGIRGLLESESCPKVCLGDNRNEETSLVTQKGLWGICSTQEATEFQD